MRRHSAKRITQVVELIETLGPDTEFDVPARFRSFAAVIFAALFGQWAAGDEKTALNRLQQAWYINLRNNAIRLPRNVGFGTRIADHITSI